jgi:dihydroorotate dehydrogenase electron transfer subunit
VKIQICKIFKNQQIAKNIFLMEIAGDFNPRDFSPGRFLHVKCSDSFETLLRRPMSICDVSDDGTKLKFIYRTEGKGTSLLSKKTERNNLDILAPLGRGFDLDEVQSGSSVLLIGGGIGIPPLYYLGRNLKSKGLKVSSILGFAGSEQVFYEKEFLEFGESTVSTDDGTYGREGRVTDFIDLSSVDFLYACGPNPMLKAIQSLVFANRSKKFLKAYLSVEERMGCGIGACLACICKPSEIGKKNYQKNYLRVCTEGPVFRADEIDFV